MWFYLLNSYYPPITLSLGVWSFVDGFKCDITIRTLKKTTIRINIYITIGDTLNLKDYLKAVDGDTGENIIERIRPVYSAASTADAAYVELDSVTGQVKNISDTAHTSIFVATINVASTVTDSVYLKVNSGTEAAG